MLMGSANVNQRSMDGERDTEIAVGCYQPIHRNNGGVRDFRMSLWYEHTGGGTSEAFSQPERADCVRELNDIADKAWQAYNGGAAVDTGGVHLIRYPLEVDHEGRLKDGGVFPDTKTPVRGKRHWWFPPILTT